MASEIMEKYHESQRLNRVVDYWSFEMKKFPSNALGLVPDEIKKTKKYRETKSNYDKVFQELREFNGDLTKKEKLEIQKLRKIFKEN